MNLHLTHIHCNHQSYHAASHHMMPFERKIIKIKRPKFMKKVAPSPKFQLLEYDRWHDWTDKSKDTPFTSSKKGTGDGELKFAAEHGTKPMGQNMTYDFNIEGKKFECKKLDEDSSFNMGVEVHQQYSLFETTMTRILDKLKELNTKLEYEPLSKIHKNFEQIPKGGKFSIYTGFTRTEISKTNLLTLSNNIDALKTIVASITPLKKRVTIDTVEHDVCHYKLLKLLDLSDDEIKTRLGAEKYTTEVIYDSFKKHLKLFNDISVQNYLTNIIRNYFHHTTLLIVDEKKGYYMTHDISQISCVRVTRGNVRGIYKPTKAKLS